MTSGNPALAELLDKDDAQPDQILAAIVDFGVLVPVDEEGSVMFIQDDDGGPLLPIYPTGEACTTHIPEAQPFPCDPLRLLDIRRATEVEWMLLSYGEKWAKIPIALIGQVLQERGVQTQVDQTIQLSRSTHPLALALRDAVGRRLLEFPGIRAVWIADVRWVETGQEQLMVQLAITAEAEPGVDNRLMTTILEEEVTLDEDAPPIAVRVLDPVAEADAIAEFDAMGLDTVTADHENAQIKIISVDLD